MQDHLKERLTGAAILVVVVVLLVPEMFRGRPAGGPEHGGQGPEGAPVRTYNIDLRDSPAAQPPVVTAPPAVATPPAESAPLGESAQPAAPPAEPVIAPPTTAPAPAPAARRDEPTASRWTVQVGSFTRRDFAERMVKQVRSRGFTVEAVGPDDRGLYRVRSAPVAERAAALALKQKMQAQGLKPIVNATP